MKTSKEVEKEFLEEVVTRTGRDMQSWMSLMRTLPGQKRNQVVRYLKEDYSLRHMEASLLAGIYLNNGQPVYQNEDDLLEAQLSRFEQWRTMYNNLSERILVEFESSMVIPKKTYISFTSNREFAAVNFKVAEIRLGLDLGDIPMGGRLEKSKLIGPMARISHMVVINDPLQIDWELINYIKKSYTRVNN